MEDDDLRLARPSIDDLNQLALAWRACERCEATRLFSPSRRPWRPWFDGAALL
jgi:hypothetical protein